MDKEKLFDEICKIKNFISFSPVTISVGLAPVHFDFKKLMSHPTVFRLIIELMAEKIRKFDFDLIAGGETAGIPWAAGLTLQSEKPLIYVRKVKISEGTIDLVEGDFKKGERVLLVDDIMGKSASKKIFIENLRAEGLIVAGILVIATNTSPWFTKYQKWMADGGIKVYYLFDFKELAEAQKKRGIIPEEVWPYYLNYIEHPEDWQENREKWQEYCQVLKHKLNIPIPESLEEMLKMK